MAEVPPLMIAVETAEIARLQVQPGDTLILRCPFEVSRSLADNLRGRLEDLFPGHRIVVLGGDATLEVLSESAPDHVAHEVSHEPKTP